MKILEEIKRQVEVQMNHLKKNIRKQEPPSYSESQKEQLIFQVERQRIPLKLVIIL